MDSEVARPVLRPVLVSGGFSVAAGRSALLITLLLLILFGLYSLAVKGSSGEGRSTTFFIYI